MAMTNKQYLTKSLNGLNVSDDDIDIIILKSSLDGDATVDVFSCDKAIYNRMSIVLKGATQNVQEGGYSITWLIPVS